MKRDYYKVNVYRCDNKILLCPWVPDIGGTHTMSTNIIQINDLENTNLIGENILGLIQYIDSLEPISGVGGTQFWAKYTKYKSLKKFLLNVAEASFLIGEDENYIIKIEHDAYLGRHYSKVGDKHKRLILPPTATAEEIGKAVIEVLDAHDAIYKNAPEPDPYPELELELINDDVLTYKTPENARFTDEGDCHAAEIYQAYSYSASENAEPVAWFSLTPGAYYAAMPVKDEVAEIWLEHYSCVDGLELSEEELGIFTRKAEMRNKKVYKLSYFVDLGDEYLLECSMEIKEPNRRKKLEEKLRGLFLKFAKSCKLNKNS